MKKPVSLNPAAYWIMAGLSSVAVGQLVSMVILTSLVAVKSASALKEQHNSQQVNHG